MVESVERRTISFLLDEFRLSPNVQVCARTLGEYPSVFSVLGNSVNALQIHLGGAFWRKRIPGASLLCVLASDLLAKIAEQLHQTPQNGAKDPHPSIIPLLTDEAASRGR